MSAAGLAQARAHLLATIDARLLSGKCAVTPDLFIRAGGDVICEICAKPYRKHPEDPEHDWLQIHCDGTRLKL